MGEMTCPRRMNEFGPWEHAENLDDWREDDTCNFCGSLKPSVVLERISEGVSVCPTDKNYKGYLESSGRNKFYFQHFSEADMRRFVELHNSKTMKVSYPGYFYRLPFFMTPLESGLSGGQAGEVT